MNVDCRRWQVVFDPEKRWLAIVRPRERGSSERGLTERSRAKRHQNPRIDGKVETRGRPSSGVSAGGRHPGPNEPRTFHEGCGQNGLGLALYGSLAKARGAAAIDDRGARGTALPTRREGRQRPLSGITVGPSRRAGWREPARSLVRLRGQPRGTNQESPRHGCSFF